MSKHPAFDLVIRHAQLIDGSGAPPREADIGIKDGIIARLGKIDGYGSAELDAKGSIVTPGFVDIHTHYDGQVTWEQRLSPSSSHGVTTVLMGNCGVGFAPVKSDQHDLVIELMEGVEDIPDVVMSEGVPWNWETFPDYLDALGERHADVAAQMPHSPLRVYVMGKRGVDREPPTEEDLSQMRGLTAQAIRAGALGVSTSRNLAHRFRNGLSAPSIDSERRELFALAHGLADAGSGVFQVIPDTNKDADGEFALFQDIIRESGRPLSFSLLVNRQQTDNFHRFLKRLKTAEAQPIPIRAQFYPRPIGILFGLDLSYHPFSPNPSYRPLAALPLAEKIARMKDPALRARLIAEQPDDPNPFFSAVVKMTAYLFPLGDPTTYSPDPDSSFARRAAKTGRPELELIYDALLEREGKADVAEYLQMTAPLFDLNNTVVALGDGGAHYGLICDAAYPTYMLKHRVGEAGLTLAQAVHALTQVPASAVGLNDRGLIAPGYRADLNIIDLEQLALEAPTVIANLPGGGRRLQQKARGYLATIVNGTVTYLNAAPTGALPGRLVRGAREVANV